MGGRRVWSIKCRGQTVTGGAFGVCEVERERPRFFGTGAIAAIEKNLRKLVR